MPPDHHVVNPDGLARSFNICPKLTVMAGSAFGKSEHVQACTELLDHREIFMRPSRFFCAIDQLGESYYGDAKLIRNIIESLAELCRTILNNVDADIRVEHITQHQNCSRFSAGGCRRSAMKSSETPGPSKNASQDWSAGVMRRLRPNFVTSTWCTLGGRATGFGNRTAWLRLVVKTVERAINFTIPSMVYPNGIYQLTVATSTRATSGASQLTSAGQGWYAYPVKNITVSVDDETYRRARTKAAERDTSLSALVRHFLVELVSEESAERCLERQERDLRAQIRDFSAGDRVSREDAHGRRE